MWVYISLFLVISTSLLITADEESLGMEIILQAENCERQAANGDQLSMHYTGTLLDGTKFDSSVDRDQPFDFQLGQGQVIKGWEQGLQGMCVGEKRKLTIPPSLGYGGQATGSIPADSTLLFDVELMDIQDGQPPQNLFKEIDLDADKMLSRGEVSDYLKSESEKHTGEDVDETQHTEMLDNIFEHEDQDKDGFISHAEFSGPKHDEL